MLQLIALNVNHILPFYYFLDFNVTSIRLVDGPNPNEDKVELQIGGRWGSIIMTNVTDTFYIKTVGSVVCQSRYLHIDNIAFMDC
jgi:hypothetical protein